MAPGEYTAARVPAKGGPIPANEKMGILSIFLLRAAWGHGRIPPQFWKVIVR